MALPPQYQAFDNDFIIATALGLYVIEFVADKIPWFDSIWDAVHTAIRPLGGAVIAVTTLGDATPTTEVLVGLLGGTLAAGGWYRTPSRWVNSPLLLQYFEDDPAAAAAARPPTLR